MSLTKIPAPGTRGFKPGVSGNPKGKPKGSKNRSSLARALGIDKKPGLMPLEFMLEVLRHPDDYPFVARQWAAKEAAPYLHRKMPIAIEGGDKPLVFLDAAKLTNMTAEDLSKLAALLEKVAPGG